MARRGKAMDPNAGSRQLEPVFEQTSFQLDYLTRPNAFSDMGFDFGKVRPGPMATGYFPSAAVTCLLSSSRMSSALPTCTSAAHADAHNQCYIPCPFGVTIAAHA